MEAKRHPVNLKQYRKVNGKWQFVAVARDAKGTPDPRLIVLHGQPVSSKGGTFYLDFKENGNRRQVAVGTGARDALEAWRTKLAQLTGLIESDPETDGPTDAGLTIDHAIENYLTRGRGDQRGQDLPSVPPGTRVVPPPLQQTVRLRAQSR
jgi:hypothetical protein